MSVLDETDSGLDIDALQVVAEGDDGAGPEIDRDEGAASTKRDVRAPGIVDHRAPWLVALLKCNGVDLPGAQIHDEHRVAIRVGRDRGAAADREGAAADRDRALRTDAPRFAGNAKDPLRRLDERAVFGVRRAPEPSEKTDDESSTQIRLHDLEPL
jgi:hypothetical protein